MGRPKRLIIPVFIPFAGCPELCVYCDQRALAGAGPSGGGAPGEDAIRSTVEAHLASWRGSGRPSAAAGVEIAFYGGTFTSMPDDRQRFYLGVGYSFMREGRVGGLRVSTRPDSVTPGGAALLAANGVKTVELGVQSMSDEVLRLSGRGHGAEAARRATAVLRDAGLCVGHQIMPGLPGDTAETAMATAEEVARLRPDFVRVYPAVVLKGTVLHDMYLKGEYRPWGIGEMAGLCASIKQVFDAASIPIARMGLQHTEELAASIVAGPHHPSFRSLVEEAGRRAAAG